MRLAVDLALSGLATYTYPGGYDSTKLGLGPLMMQSSAGWVGPLPAAWCGVQDIIAANGFGGWVSAMQWSSTVDWIFVSGIGGGATYTAYLLTYDRSIGALQYRGQITVNPPNAAGNYTPRAMQHAMVLHTAGTVSTSGTAVTGTSTSWQTDRACVGNRIGFGSTDPTQITAWYEISAITNDGRLTLVGAPPSNFGGSTSYVIEDLRLLFWTVSSTAAKSGLQLVKGLRFENFSFN